MQTRRTVVTLLCLSTMAISDGSLVAQSYPTRPIRFIVPFAAGGPSDFVARTLGEALSKRLSQTVVIENRPGADGLIAAQAVLGAPGDGHTLLMGGSSLPPLSLLKNPPPFDVVTDLAPVSRVTRLEWAMYVSPQMPARSIAEFTEFARGNPDKLSYASSNLSEHLGAALFMKATGTKLVRVPYKGFAQVLPDVMTGRVHMNVAPLSAVLPYAKDGRVRMLAVLMPQRSRFAPDVPSIVEAGLSSVSVPGWQAIFASGKTPKDVLDRLNLEISRSLRDPEVNARFERQAVQLQGSTAGELAAILGNDLRTWREFIRDNGIEALTSN